MGRGLSDLQRAILRLALTNRADPHRRAQVDLYTAEILVDLYHWPTTVPLARGPGLQHFDRDAIGHDRYNTVRASVSRALRRLEDRGLIARYDGVTARWTGLRLTDQGLTTAEHLFVNTEVGRTQS
jgi:hypothetical protein